jgi:hypothetical protein
MTLPKFTPIRIALIVAYVAALIVVYGDMFVFRSTL